MEKTYQIAEKNDSRSLAEFLAKHGQGLLPMVELIEQSQKAVDDLIDVVGRATIEAVLRLSAQGIAGPPHPGKKGGAVGWHGREKRTLCEWKSPPTRAAVGDGRNSGQTAPAMLGDYGTSTGSPSVRENTPQPSPKDIL